LAAPPSSKLKLRRSILATITATFKPLVTEVAVVVVAVVVAVEVVEDVEELVPNNQAVKVKTKPSKVLVVSKSALVADVVAVEDAVVSIVIMRTPLVVVLRITTSLELDTLPTKPRRVAVDTTTGVVLRKALKTSKDTTLISAT